MPHLARITIYPVKSLDGHSLASARILPSGAIENDRRYALVDSDGQFLNGKRTPAIHAIRSSFDPETRVLTIRIEGADGARRFGLDQDHDRASLGTYLSEVFGQEVTLVEDSESGFPDDTDAPGPTVLGTGTVNAVAGWFGLEPDEIRGRFRANLEVDDVEPFWEDRLFGAVGSFVRFRIGGVVFEGTNPCRRCVVPSRSPTTGDAIPGFQKEFAERRQESLPGWAEASRFEHFYRLAVNTRLAPDGPGVIRVGDAVAILAAP